MKIFTFSCSLCRTIRHLKSESKWADHVDRIEDKKYVRDFVGDCLEQPSGYRDMSVTWM